MLVAAWISRCVLMLTVLVVLGSALPAHEVDAGELPSEVQAVLRKQFASPDAETRYLDGTVDLNADGKPELLVHVVGPMVCGSGGCPTMVFTRVGGGYRLVSSLSVTRTPVRVASARTQGWRNLIVRVGGGGAMAGDVELAFDGKSYPRNPTVAGPRVKATNGEGAETVIAELTSLADAELLPPAEPARAAAAAPASGPSYDCAKAVTPVERAICDDPSLAALDRTLDAAYVQAMRDWPADEKTAQRTAQRAWMANRNACAKAGDVNACIMASYRRRVVEVQIGSGRLRAPTPVGYACSGHEDTPFTAAFYGQTDPKSAVLTFGDRQVIAMSVPTASGARYASDAVDFWEHHGEATVTWSGVTYVCKSRRTNAEPLD